MALITFTIQVPDNLSIGEINDKLCENFVGMQDYIDSAIVVHDNGFETGVVIAPKDCVDKQEALDKFREVFNKTLDMPEIRDLFNDEVKDNADKT